MDKAPDFGSGDCRFESCHGRYLLSLESFLGASDFSTMILAHCCNRPLSCSGQSCCCNCCNLPKVEYGALVCSDLETAYILDADGKPMLVPQYEEVGRSIELVDTEEAKAAEE